MSDVSERHGLEVHRRASNRRPKFTSPFVTLTASALLLTAVGVGAVLAASRTYSQLAYGSGWYFFTRQVVWATIGLAFLMILERIDYHSILKMTIPVLIIAVTLLVVVLRQPMIDGSTRWFAVGSLYFRPSDFAKLALVLCAATQLSKHDPALTTSRYVRGLVVVSLAMITLLLLEPDLIAALEMLTLLLICLLAAGTRFRFILRIVVPTAVLASLLLAAAPYRRARLTAYLHPAVNVTDISYGIWQSFIAIGSGGVTGTGIGQGHSTWLFLPGAHTAYIFSVIAEQSGLLGCVLVMFLFAVLVTSGLRIGARAPDRGGAILATGITTSLAIRALLNIGAVTGLVPSAGFELPFMSAGGSTIALDLASIGIVLNIARNSHPTEQRPRSWLAGRASGGTAPFGNSVASE